MSSTSRILTFLILHQCEDFRKAKISDIAVSHVAPSIFKDRPRFELKLHTRALNDVKQSVFLGPSYRFPRTLIHVLAPKLFEGGGLRSDRGDGDDHDDA